MLLRKLFIVACCLLLGANFAHTQINRPYEPIVLTGDTLFSQFFNYEIKYLYLYAYDARTDTWRMIPFQIDEVNPHDQDSMYFKPDSSFGLLDSDDELVFLLNENDLGDKADSTSWLDGADSMRYEICLIDSVINTMSYVYLYSSQAVSEPVPSPYAMAYDSLADRITTANYEVGFNETGQLADVIISGSGIDIFDRMKFRLMGSFFIPANPIYEDQLERLYWYAKVGPVRIIRNVYGRFHYEWGEIIKFDSKATQTSKFYPWNGEFALFEIPVEDVVNYGVEVDVIRLSWDFNRNAIGMKFYSESNRGGVSIDGSGGVDNIDRTCFPDNLNWTMGTGDLGTILNIFYVPPLGEKIRTYFFDDTTSGKSGDDYGINFDTGDGFSFGDNGFSLEKNIEDSIKAGSTLNVIYYNFFLPPNFSPDDASTVCTHLKSPLDYAASPQKLKRPSNITQSSGFVPADFELYQNYPNPFNAATTISFALPRKTRTTLRIYDTLGRLVATLVDETLPQGVHHYIWQGQDEQGWSIPSGLYIYKLDTAEFNSTRKLLLIK